MAIAQTPPTLPRPGSSSETTDASMPPSTLAQPAMKNGLAGSLSARAKPQRLKGEHPRVAQSSPTSRREPCGSSASPSKELTNTSETRRKRTRPVSACEACRAHKVKCILKPDQPICERCAASDKECVFRIDDLRPDFRAERFSHLGPPGAEAREIKSKPKDRKKDGNRHREETSATSAGDADDTHGRLVNDAGDDDSTGSVKGRKLIKQSSSSAGTTDEGKVQAPKPKSVFKFVANPHHLAAPVLSASSALAPPPPGMARPGPSIHSAACAAHSAFRTYSQQQPQVGHMMAAPPPLSSAGPAPYQPGLGHQQHAYGYPDVHYTAPQPYGPRPSASCPEGIVSYSDSTLHPSGLSPTTSGRALSQSPTERGYQHGRMLSVASSSSGAALPPIRMAFPSLDEASNTSVHTADKRSRHGEWDRSSTAASENRSERPFSPFIARSPATHQPHEIHWPDKGRSAPTPSKVAFQLPQSEHTPAVDHPTVESQGSKGSGTKKTSLVVPFFRWFGMTANTPGYRRIKVAVNPDLPEEEDEGAIVGTEQNAGSEGVAAEQKRRASRDGPAGIHEADARRREDSEDLSSAKIVKSSAGLAASPKAFSPRVSTAKTSSKDAADVGACSTPKLRGDDFTLLGGICPGHCSLAALEQGSIASSTSRDLFDPLRPRYPRKDVLLHLSELFIKHYRTNLCPWIIEAELIASAKDCTMPSILANSICAMTARFSDWAELRRKPPKSAGEPFSEMAKTLIVPMLSWPSLDVIEALIILSYAEFGAGSDSGLWMYSGMGMRMAIDLGIEHESTIVSLPSEAQQTKARWLFWSGCYVIDRITCFGTGRLVTLLDHAIDCQPPQVDHTADTFYASQIIQILLRRGRMGELLNRRDDGMTLGEKKVKLTEIWQECASYFQSLPSTCAFGVQSFKRAASKNQGAAFLYLHVLFQSTISLLERPGLMRSRELESTPSAFGAVTHISASASRSIVDMIALAVQVDPKSFHACPYLDQLILPAGRLFVSERECVNEVMRHCGYLPGQSRQSSPTRGLTKAQDDRLASLMRQRKTISDHLSNCIAWLSKLAYHWGGASWPARALEQEAAGASDVIPDLDDDDAMQAPLRDMELLSSWAKEKVKKAKGRMASRRGSLQPGSGVPDIAKGKDGPSTLGSPDATTSIANLLAAANAAQESAPSTTGSSGGLDDNPLGLALSGQLATLAEIDIHALVDMWAAEQERPQNGSGTYGPTTPRASGSAHSGKLWDSLNVNGNDNNAKVQTHSNGAHAMQQPGYCFGQGNASSNSYGTGIGGGGGYMGFSNLSGHPPVDFSALQLEELLSADLGVASGDDVFPLELPTEDFQFNGMYGASGGNHGFNSLRQGASHGHPSSGAARSDNHPPSDGFNQAYPVGVLPQGFSSALFGFH